MGSSTENGQDKRKEEILAKSKQEGKDEFVEHAIDKGAKLGNYYTELVGAVLLFFCILTGQIVTIWALLTLYGAHAFGNFLAKYRVLKQKRYLFIGAILLGVVYGGIFGFLFLRDSGLLQRWLG